MLKQQVPERRKLNIDNQVNNEELEQSDRHLCFRTDDLLKFVKSLFREVKVNIQEAVVDRAHKIGPNYLDKSTNKNYKSII